MDADDNKIKDRKNVVFFVLTVSLSIFLIFLFFSTALIYVFGESAGELNSWLLVIDELIFLLLPSIIAAKFLNVNLKYIFRMNIPSLKMVIIGIAGVFFLEMFSDGIVSLQKFILPESWGYVYQRMLDEYLQKMSNIVGNGDFWLLLQSIFIIAIVPAISEEFLFRGFLQTTLEYNTKISYAIILSSVLFGAMHLNPIFFIPLAVAGAFFGIAAYTSSSIILPIILHFVTNTVSIINIFYSDSNGLTADKGSISLAIIFVTSGALGLALMAWYLFRERAKIKNDLQIGD